MTEHCQLKVALNRIRYPEGIISCSQALKRAGISCASDGYGAIRGQSFFPGGNGHSGPNLPVGGIMFLGNYFDKVGGFVQSVKRGYEENLTWRCIRSAMLNHLLEETIWFSNYFMGVSDGTTNIGPLKRAADFLAYEEDCWGFLNLQVILQRPAVIAVLGRSVVQPLSAPGRLNIPSWQIKNNDPYDPLRMKMYDAHFCHNSQTVKTKMIAVYHPSYGRGKSKLAEIERDASFIASQLHTSASGSGISL